MSAEKLLAKAGRPGGPDDAAIKQALRRGLHYGAPEGILLALQESGFIIARDPRAVYPNGRPMFDGTGMMLDERGNRSIFDDVDR